MPIQIIHASMDERRKLSGGSAGDQTGTEVCIRSWYSRPWQYYMECTDSALADRAASLFEAIARSNKCGYDQGNRLSLYQALTACNGDIANIALCETDCSAAVAGIYRFLGLPVSPSCTTRNIRAALKATGAFQVYSDTAHVASDRYAKRGGLYLTEGSHIVMAKDNGSAYSASAHPVSGANSLIKQGQQYAIDFTGVTIQVDGVVGSETGKMKHRILQHAMNSDYHAGLAEDGCVGPASKKALGSHYVTKGEKQYMVTAAEILMYLNGIDPKGVEYPGIYGNGLVSAARQKFGGTGIRINAGDFLTLIQ